MRKRALLAAAGFAACAASAAEAADGPTAEVFGRIFYDHVAQDVDRAVESGANIDYEASDSRLRTARLGVKGEWTDAFSYKVELSANGRDDPQWEDVILEYRPRKGAALRLGHMKVVSLENLTSSRFITFMERGALNDIVDGGRVTALQGALNGANWTAAVSVIGDNVNDDGPPVNPVTGSAKESTGAALRVTYAPALSDRAQVHLGAWARYREANDDTLFRYRTRNNTNYGERFTDTGANFDGDTTLGAEAAVVMGAFSVQGEYAVIRADPASSAAAGGEVKAGYVFASWFPTGETRPYKASKGAFDRVKVLRPVAGGGMGAVELALRYDFADATDFSALNPAAGQYSAWTAGATWHPLSHLRFMANYTRAENDPAGVTFRDVDVETLQVRAQFDF